MCSFRHTCKLSRLYGLTLKSMEWADRQELPQDRFRSQLRQAVQASPQKSVLVIVWGFRDWFRSAALKTAYTAYVLDINTPVLLFDWPGNQGEGFSGYTASQRMATQVRPGSRTYPGQCYPGHRGGECLVNGE